MKLREIMTEGVEFTDPEKTVQEVAKAMREGGFGLMPVGENDRLIGTLSDRDIVLNCVAEGRDPSATRVRDAMNEGIHYCFDDQDLKEAAKLMSEKQVRRLPVLNRDKRMVGIVSLSDLAESGNTEVAAVALGGVSRT